VTIELLLTDCQEIDIEELGEGELIVVQDDEDGRHILMRNLTMCSITYFEKVSLSGCLVGKGTKVSTWDYDLSINVPTKVA